MGSSESKQAAARLDESSLSKIEFPPTLHLQYQSALSLKLRLCDEDSNPLCLVTQPSGPCGELVVYGGPSRDDAPLGIVTQSRAKPLCFAVHSTVRLAPTLQGGPATEEELRMIGNGALGVAYAFVMAVGPGGLPERFEWRASGGDEVRSLGQRSHGWKLVRLGSRRALDGDRDRQGEVVAVWADVNVTKSRHRTAKFGFVGSGGRDGGLGEVWRAMAVMTFLRLWQLNSQSGAGAASSSNAAVVAASV